ncbi:MAG: hypothetical protein KGL39_43525 [Patescibacteria group bacterium]|nr:hypothetical protein [Patescibacteria group bacterium]
MAITPITDGPTKVQVGTGAGNALQDLGYTRNGVNGVSNGFFLPIPCDDNGGDEGPPADIQYLGETWQLEMEFTKFDVVVMDTVTPRLLGGQAGLPGTATGGITYTAGGLGALMFSGGYTIRTLLTPQTSAGNARPKNFPQVVFQEPMQINKGTRFSTWITRGTAYRNGAGVLWNTQTS